MAARWIPAARRLEVGCADDATTPGRCSTTASIVHHGFAASSTRAIFEPGFRLLRQVRFQLRLNNLFEFERRADAG